MANRVLLGGLSMLEVEASGASLPGPFNMTEGWPLFQNPAHLLWADEILVPSSAYDNADNLCLFSPECHGPAMDLLRELVRNAWDKLKEKRIVSRLQVDPDLVEAYEKAKQRVTRRIAALPTEDDDGARQAGWPVTRRRGSRTELVIGGTAHCSNFIASIVAALVASRLLGANWLMPVRYTAAVNWLLGDVDAIEDRSVAIRTSLGALCDLFIPSIGLFPPLWKCHDVKCDSQDTCVPERRGIWENGATKAIYKLLELRDTDEMSSLRLLIANCASELQRSAKSNDLREAKRLLLEKNLDARRSLTMTFPSIDRWTDIAMLVSLPMSLAAFITGRNELGVVGAAIATGSQMLTRGAKLLRARHSWVTFVERVSSQNEDPAH